MASKTSEERPKSFFPTLIISIVVAFIIIHAAFLKLTSDTDAASDEKLYGRATLLKSTDRKPSIGKDSSAIEEPVNIKKPSFTREPSYSREQSFIKELSIKKGEPALIREESREITTSETPAHMTQEIPVSPDLQKGYRYHQLGHHEKAIREWEKVITSSQHRSDFTIQLLLACQKDTITRSFKNSESPERLFYLKWHHDGRDCYKLCTGLYKSKKEAETGRQHVPEYFLKHGNKPIVVSISSLVKGRS